MSPADAKREAETALVLPHGAFPRINTGSNVRQKQHESDRNPAPPRFPLGPDGTPENPSTNLYPLRETYGVKHHFLQDGSTTKARLVGPNGFWTNFSEKSTTAPTLLSPSHPGEIEVIGELVNGKHRYSKNGPPESEFFTPDGPMRQQVHVTTSQKNKPIKKSTNQKWAVSQRFVKFICRSWGNQEFFSGYFVYADNFDEDSKILGALAIITTSVNLYVNPPFNEIIPHLHHWLNVALKSNRSYIVVSPVLINSEEWKYFVRLAITVVVFLKNPVSFENIRDNYNRPGVCPKRICLFFLNVAGENIIVENDEDGVFSFPNEWYKKLKCQPLQPNNTMNWSAIPSLVNNYKKAQQKFILAQKSPFNFTDLLPSVTSSVDSNLFTPLSPLWDAHLSPILKRHFGESYTARSRDAISLARSEHLLDLHQGQFYPPGPNLCNLCGSESHPSHACFLRIPSASDLGIFHRHDLEMYKFLLDQFPFYEELQPIPGEPIAQRCRRFRSTITLRERCFISLTNRHFETIKPPLKWPWHIAGFSQIRNNLPHHVALGKPLWILIGVAFGIHYPYLQIPPIRSIGRIPPTIDDEMYALCAKEALRWTFLRCPADFPDNIHPFFGAISSEKLRLLFNLRWFNGYLAKFKYQQPTIDEFLRHLRAQDYLWFEDMTACFQQLSVCPADKRRLGFQFYYKGRLFTMVANYALFGASANTFLVKERYKAEVRLCNLVNERVIQWVDDVNGIISGDLSREDMNTVRHFNKYIYENGGTMFGDKGVRWIPQPFISSLGWVTSAPHLLKMPPFEKIEKLLAQCNETINSESTSLRELSSIAGKFISYGSPITRLVTQQLYNIMSARLMSISHAFYLTKYKGSFHPKEPETLPQIWNLNQPELPSSTLLPDSATKANTSSSANITKKSESSPTTVAKAHYQAVYQKQVQQAAGDQIAITFRPLPNFHSTPITKEFYNKPFPTPKELAHIFAQWFSCLETTLTKIEHKQPIVDWDAAFFLICDASDIGVGAHVVYQDKSYPTNLDIKVSMHKAFPPALQSFVNSNNNEAIRSSCAREAYGLYTVVRELYLWLEKNYDHSNGDHFSIPSIPLLIFTDSLGIAHMFRTKNIQNHITLFYINEAYRILTAIGQPYALIWKPRSCPSAQAADLASKMPPWSLTQKTLQKISKTFKIRTPLIPDYLMSPVELLNLSEMSLPPKLQQYHKSRKLAFIILPPNFPKGSYETISLCLLKFNIRGFLIVPELKYTPWFTHIQEKLGNHLALPTSKEWFQSTIFHKSSKRYKFNMAIFHFQARHKKLLPTFRHVELQC